MLSGNKVFLRHFAVNPYPGKCLKTTGLLQSSFKTKTLYIDTFTLLPTLITSQCCAVKIAHMTTCVGHLFSYSLVQQKCGC